MRIVHIEFVDRAVTLIRVNVIPLVRGYRSGDAAWVANRAIGCIHGVANIYNLR
jgi:hypothetical protein